MCEKYVTQSVPVYASSLALPQSAVAISLMSLTSQQQVSTAEMHQALVEVTWLI